MKLYELTYLISPEVSEQETKSLQEKTISTIEKMEGVLDESTLPFKIKLAYPIKKKTEAFFANLKFYLNEEKIKELENELRAEKKILRYLILTKPKIKIAKTKKELPKPTPKIFPKEKKVELKEIEKKLEEILEKDYES
jgi:small subunit ribosomal protein S6